MVRTLAELAELFEIVAIGYDRWGMAELERILDEEGITLPMREHGQGYADMGLSVSSTEERVLNRELLAQRQSVPDLGHSNVRLSCDSAGNASRTRTELASGLTRSSP